MTLIMNALKHYILKKVSITACSVGNLTNNICLLHTLSKIVLKTDTID